MDNSQNDAIKTYEINKIDEFNSKNMNKDNNMNIDNNMKENNDIKPEIENNQNSNVIKNNKIDDNEFENENDVKIKIENKSETESETDDESNKGSRYISKEGMVNEDKGEDDYKQKYDREKGFRKRLFQIIEVANSGDTVSAVYDVLIIITIILSLVPLTFKESYVFFDYMEKVVVSIFIMDYLFRLITADYKLKTRIRFLSFIIYPFTPWAIIDLLSILPSLKFLYSGLKLLRILNLIKTLRIIRAVKAFRYSNSINIIAEVIKNSKRPLSAVVGLAAGYVLISALIIFNVEGDTFDNFFSVVYWATTSLTTVGYGDIYPHTTEGRVIAMISSVCGVALIALPSGIITAGYMDSLNASSAKEEKEEKARRLEKERKKKEKKERRKMKKEQKKLLMKKKKEQVQQE